MNYETLEKEVMKRVVWIDNLHKKKYGRESFNPAWDSLKHIRWFVSCEMVKWILEMTNKEKARDCFDGTFPSCTNKEEVEQWLKEEDENGTEDSQIIDAIKEHFGEAK